MCSLQGWFWQPSCSLQSSRQAGREPTEPIKRRLATACRKPRTADTSSQVARKAWGAAYSVQQTSDGGYISTGYQAATEDGKYHLALVKISSSGEEMWTRTDMSWFPHDSTGGIGLSVRETSDGGYILTGYRKPFIFGEITDLWLIKANSEGELEWSKTHGGDNPDWGACVRQTQDGGYIIAGCTNTDWSYMVLKTDVAGDTVWVSGLPFSWYSKGQWVEQTTDGGYITTGYGIPVEDGKHHLFVMKMTSLGDTSWMRMEQGDFPEQFEWFPDQLGGVSRCVRQTSDDNFILTGHTAEWIDEINDLFLVKLNQDGDTIWTRIYGGANEDMGYCVDQCTDGGYIVVGATKSFGAGDYDIWLLKTDAAGDTLGVAEEPPVTHLTHPSNWQVLNPVGQRIVLQYSDCPHGFHAEVFDATGRKVDELKSPAQNGILTWGEKHSTGVYFFRSLGSKRETVKKAVLMR
jgi:hypothetical protein